MHRFAIHGWDDEAPRLLEALQCAGAFTLVAVGDRSGSALVRARAATGSPCYQHPLEMFRHARYDVALLATSEGTVQAAQAAARAGAAVILAGEHADGTTIIEAAEAALRGRVPFAVMRPRLQHAGVALLADLAASDSGWSPRFLDMTIQSPSGATAIARDALALANRLMRGAASYVAGSALGGHEGAEPAAVAAELRYADGRLARVGARSARDERWRLFADCPRGELELRTEGGIATLTVTPASGPSEMSRLTLDDTVSLEARRVARVLAGGAGDALLAPRDGSVLLALERSLESGEVTAVEEPSSRANLILVRGQGLPVSEPRGRLRLVGA